MKEKEEKRGQEKKKNTQTVGLQKKMITVRHPL